MMFVPTVKAARTSARRLAMLAIVLLTATGAAAVENGPPAEADDDRPITAYTSDPAARRAGGPAEQLLRQAREQGRIHVIVGLRIVTRMEHTLSDVQVEQQRRVQRRVEDAVIARVLGSPSAPGIDRFEFIPYMAMTVNAAQLERLLADPQVASVEKDVMLKPELSESIPLIHADDVFAKHINGTGQVVAVIDGGVDKTHPMLKDKVVAEACYSRHSPPQQTSTCPGMVTASTAPGSGVNCPVAISGCDHGTHVASIAAGNSNLFDGVGRDAQIIAINVATRANGAACGGTPTCIQFFTASWIKGLSRVYALRNQFKIAAVNLSIGGALYNAPCDGATPSATTAFKILRAAGIAPIKSAGNNSSNTSVTFPGCISYAIAVGNTIKTDPWVDQIYRDSNHSPLVKLMAPGTYVKAAVPAGAPCIRNGDPHCRKTGTSQAAPHVAGAFALLRNAKPEATVDEILEALTCTGKTVDHRFRSRTLAPVEVDPARPRIDLIAAYNHLLAPPNVRRTWSFTTPDDADDWSPFRGQWAVQDGQYLTTLAGTGFEVRRSASSVANCNTHLQVVARLRLSGDSGRFGVFLKSTLNHKDETVSGYHLVVDKDNLPGTSHVERWDNYNLDGGGGSTPIICNGKAVPINAEGFNTIKAVSRGAQHSFYVNGTLVCTVNDATYAHGPVMVLATNYNLNPQFAVDMVQITSLSAASAPEALDSSMDPGAFAPKPHRVGARSSRVGEP